MKHAFVLIVLAAMHSSVAKAHSGSGGGLSGGGGNVLGPTAPIHPASIAEASEVVDAASAFLPSLLASYQARWTHRQLSPHAQRIFGELFHQRSNIVAIARRTPVEVKATGPCLDVYRRPVDGCRYSQVPGHVCISAASLSRKVEKERLFPQATALLAHELSEVAGFDEARAVRLQRALLDDMSAAAER